MTGTTEPSDQPLFRRVDWERQTDRPWILSLSTWVALAGLVPLGVMFAYDYLQVSNTEPFFGTWKAPIIDWLLLVSLVLFGAYALLPLATNHRTRRRLWAQIRSQPAVAASVGWLLVVFVGGTVGSVLLGQPVKHVSIPYQPPAFLSSDTLLTSKCVGAVVDGRCQGTLLYPFGTNVYGEDVGALIISGMRVAVTLSLVTATILVSIATAVGTVAGFVGGRVDAILTGYVDLQRTVPAFLVYVIFAFLAKPSLLVLVVVFGFLNWGGIAHVVRSEVKAIREAGYVRAARSAGAGRLHVLRHHVLPNVSGGVAVATTRQIATLILVEAAIAYLELSDVMVRSWGEIAATGMGHWFPVNWWVVAGPGLALVFTVVAVSVFGDTLRDVFDPRGVP
ncbi:MAG: peptide/nickel transport system permease protein [Halobacteriales archaeon]|jgi:peptide/nickel transport system permease protein